MKTRFFKMLFFTMLVILNGCEGGIDITGSEVPDVGVSVNMTIKLVNGSDTEAYMLIDNEMQNSETLVPAGGTRTDNLGVLLSHDSRYEHKYDLILIVRWGEGNSEETTHVVDYKKYSLTMQGVGEPPLLNLQINATFDGNAIVVSETQI